MYDSSPRFDAEALKSWGSATSLSGDMANNLIRKLSKRYGPAPAWSDATAHAAILKATVVHYGHAQDERSLSTRSSPSDKPVAGVP